MKKLFSIVCLLVACVAQAQDKEEKLKRDVEVAENVLSTIIRQQIDKRSTFWPMEVKGSYTPGYGVTLRVPYDNWTFTIAAGAPLVWGDADSENLAVISRDRWDEEEVKVRGQADRERLKTTRATSRDSARNAYGNKIIEAAKMFLADYGDLIGVDPSEKILITTKSERSSYNFNFAISGDADKRNPKKRVISVEALKSDLTAYKQNKISREQLLAKLKVVNSELNDEAQPDLELLSTIFGRLYRSDLSKTYFMEGTPYYECLKDFGVTYYMQVYSSNNSNYNRYSMPTLDLSDLTQEERDKKVKELYPIFEKEIKDNLLEYGRTLSSLKEEEMVVFDIQLTKCKGCGIPATVEYSVKAGVLKDYGQGKLNKEAALAKIVVKKGNLQ